MSMQKTFTGSHHNACPLLMPHPCSRPLDGPGPTLSPGPSMSVGTQTMRSRRGPRSHGRLARPSGTKVSTRSRDALRAQRGGHNPMRPGQQSEARPALGAA